MKKRALILVLLVSVALLLAGCPTTETAQPEPALVPEPVVASEPEPTPEPVVEPEPTPEPEVVVEPTPEPVVAAPEPLPVLEVTLEADDKGFYPTKTVNAKKGQTVRLTFKVRTTRVYFSGLQFKSDLFDSGAISPGDSYTAEFVADQDFEFKSYWPKRLVLKSTGSVIVE